MKKYSTKEEDIQNFVEENRVLINSKGLDDIKENMGIANSNYKRATSTTLGKVLFWIVISIVIVMIILLLIGIFTANVFQYVKFILILFLLVAAMFMFKL